jgi:hypothetical protein
MIFGLRIGIHSPVDPLHERLLVSTRQQCDVSDWLSTRLRRVPS